MHRAQRVVEHLAPAPAGGQIEEVFIVSACRTPLGTFGGGLSQLAATELGGIAIAEAVKRAGLPAEAVQEVYMGNVLSADLGQAPARRAAKLGGLPDSSCCTTVNKVCSSGLKCVMLGAQAIMLGQQQCNRPWWAVRAGSGVVAGGMESMSGCPFYVPSMRWGHKLNNSQLVDGCVKDGLWDPYNDVHMGSCAEVCAARYSISRSDQDQYALQSYARAQKAAEQGAPLPGRQLSPGAGKFGEIVPVSSGSGKRRVVVERDEQITKLAPDRMHALRPVFQAQEGTVTAGNASPLSDGAAALVLVSGDMVRRLKLQPLAKVIGFADAEKPPVEFTTAPSDAIPKALGQAGKTLAEVDFFEINEAFSVVSLANNKLLELDPDKVNVYGGAVAMGHPLGCSGARILVTLCSVLAQEGGKIGVAGICNGGGGASALVIEKC